MLPSRAALWVGSLPSRVGPCEGVPAAPAGVFWATVAVGDRDGASPVVSHHSVVAQSVVVVVPLKNHPRPLRWQQEDIVMVVASDRAYRHRETPAFVRQQGWPPVMTVAIGVVLSAGVVAAALAGVPLPRERLASAVVVGVLCIAAVPAWVPHGGAVVRVCTLFP